MAIQLYLICIDKYPGEIADPDQMILMHDEGAEPEQLDLNELGFITTLGVRSGAPGRVLEDFKDWWKSVAEGYPVIELLADDEYQLQKYRRDEINSIEIDTWTLKTNFVAYLRSDAEAYKSAVSLIKESELNGQ